MAITLDSIADKVFSEVGGGYNRDEVDGFLDEIMDEMERREADTRALQEQVAAGKKRIEELTQQLESVKNTQSSDSLDQGRRSAESFELVLAKAKNVYEEIVGDADKKAEEIVSQANADAASIREKAEAGIRELTQQLDAAKKNSKEYCEAISKLMGDQNAVLDGLKKLID